MSTWIDEGIAAMEIMKGDIDNALATLRKLQGGQPAPPAALPRPLGARPTAPRKPREKVNGKANGNGHAPAAVMTRETRQDAIVAERDATILAHLKHGEATRGELVKIIPVVPGQTDDQRAQNCGNAIMRLKAKKKIQQTDTGWALA